MLKYNSASMIGRIHEAVNSRIIFELERRGIEGIVPSHGDILARLYQEDGLSIKELAEKIHRTQPTVTVLVNKLEKLGYVKRTKGKEDARVTSIYLTDKGMELEPVFQSISDVLNEVIYGGLSDSEREQLEKLLDHVYRRF
ncbi:MarR family winged helix-turn-helix transcriptional regulator [Paenibacillus sp. TH7-28]